MSVKPCMLIAGLVSCTSVLLTIIAQLLFEMDTSWLFSAAIAFVLLSSLAISAFLNAGKQRAIVLISLAAYSIFLVVLQTHYSLARDHVRWLFLSSHFMAS